MGSSEDRLAAAALDCVGTGDVIEREMEKPEGCGSCEFNVF